MNLYFKESPFRISILITLVIYIAIIFVFNSVIIDESDDLNSKNIYLEIKHYRKKENKKTKEVIQSKEITKKNLSNKIEKKSIPHLDKTPEEIEVTEILDTNLISTNDTIKNHQNYLDSIIVKYPNLIALKAVLKEMIKNNPHEETDSAMAVRRLKEGMIEYYKNKYPTPLSKFGEPNQGFPIEKIIDFFSTHDTVDVKRIKKYLGLDKN